MKKLIGIGTGPGAADLLTVRAVRAIEKADFIFVPNNKGKTMALDTVEPYLKEKEIIPLSFPMGKTTTKTYKEAAHTIIQTLDENQTGVFLTIGDSTIYSTFLNLIDNNLDYKGEIELELIPGIPSYVAAANSIGINLAKKGESFLLLDSVDEETILEADNIAILKTVKVEDTLDRLEAAGYHYDYIEHISFDNELHLTDREEILKRNNYMSLILARKV